MASFRIWGCVEQIDEDRFMVIASAIAPQDESTTFVITDHATDADEARGRLSMLMARLDARVRAGGGTVTAVEIR